MMNKLIERTFESMMPFIKFGLFLWEVQQILKRRNDRLMGLHDQERD